MQRAHLRAMTINVLRGRSAEDPEVAPEPMPIGEVDTEIFNCPVCTRPLARGVRRCPGCRTRLVMAVPVGRASLFVAVGLAAGIVVGAGVVSAAAVGRPSDGRPGGGPIAGASAPPAAGSPGPGSPAPGSASPSVAPSGVPSAALAALGQSVTMNGRMLAGAGTLRAALVETDLDTAVVVRTLRSLAADAAWAADATKRLDAWPAAALVEADLEAFYEEVRETAREALRASMSNDAAYRSSGTRMVEVLDAIPSLDAASRAVAARAGINLPPLAIPSPS